MSVYEYLVKKGFKKVHQPKKRYNLTIEEIVTLLEDFAHYQQNFKFVDSIDTHQLKLWI